MKTKAALVVGIILAVLLGVSACGNDSAPDVKKEVDNAASSGPAPSSAQIVDGVDGIVLDEPGDSGVVITEYMDFQCPACKSHTKLVTEGLEKYAGKVTFAVSPLPLTNIHPNAVQAWSAAIAANNQGKFVPMYKVLFSTQESWSDTDDDQSALFRDYAEEMGLDMDKYDADVKSAETKTLIDDSSAKAIELGAEGTPTWVMDGKVLDFASEEDFWAQIDQAVEGASSK